MPYEFVDDTPKAKYEFVDTPAEPITRTDKVLKGMKDPIDGGAQLLTHILPQGMVDAGNRFNNWLADKTGLVAKLPERNLSSVITGQKSGVDGLIQQQEAEYQAQRAAAGESGIDGYRMFGNVASPANIALAAKLPMAAAKAPMVVKAVLGAAGGGASALLNPVVGDDYWTEKGKQGATGAAFGAAAPAVVSGLSRVISPNASLNPQLATLKAEGVRPTVGQSLGGWANRVEEKAQSVPIIGDAIAAARNRSTVDMNRAAFNRALSPVGEKLPMDVKLGGEAVEYTRKLLGDKYDEILPKLTTQADEPFVSSLASLRASVAESALDPKYASKFDQILKDRVIGKFQGQDVATGQTVKDVQSFISNEIKRYGQSQDPDARLLGDALKEVGSQINSLLVRSNPKHAEELAAINSGWANFKRVQKASGYLGADDGVFTASQLQSAVKAADRSKDKARFAEGNALMQDLSGASKNLLANKVPNSGTVDRALLATGGLGAGLVNPMIPAGLLGGAAMYTAPMQALMRGAVSARPQGAKAVADTFEQAAPFLIPGGAQLGLGLLN